MYLKIFTLLLIALLATSCEDRAKPNKIACSGPTCDTDGDGLLDNDSNETDLNDPCVPVQEHNYTGYDNSNEIWRAGDCDKDGYTNGNEDNSGDILSNPYDYNQSCFIFEDKKYCETKLDEIWLDRNLGASAKCDGDINNTECFGDYYQWGRLTDDHEKSDSPVIFNTALAVGNSFSIFRLSANKDWNTHTDYDGQKRAALWNNDNDGLLCPKGWKIPKIDLLVDAGHEALDIPKAGYRAGQNGVILQQDAALWSASIQANQSRNSILFYGQNNISHTGRANGLPLRCVKIK